MTAPAAQPAAELECWDVARIATPLDLGPGAKCVVTGRHGGRSISGEDAEGRWRDYGSLNLGDHVGDEHAHVIANRQLVCDALGLRSLTIADQTHTANIAHITEALAGAGHSSADDARARLGATDGLVTDVAGIALAILVADCVPVALHDPEHAAIGVAHAGRGGTVSGVLPNLIGEMVRRFGTDPTCLQAAFGPHIGPDDYEVGRDEVDAFLAAFGGDESLILRTDRAAGTASLDLEGALRTQLNAAGVDAGRVTTSGVDTRAASDRYFSDRYARFDRNGAQSGRFALICWLPE